MGLVPFLKWAGGKRQLLSEIKSRMPESYHTYYEPFVGGGAVVFDLQPEHAVINDINCALINTYIQVRDMPDQVLAWIKEFDSGLQGRESKQEAKEYYYYMRKQYNAKLALGIYDAQSAAMFVFLNKHCFNGLYRVNAQGLFNVPYNNKTGDSVQESEIYAVSAYLKNITILNQDFEDAVTNAGSGDFVFMDSPYVPLNAQSFESYTKDGFDLESHERVAKLFDELTERGCFCMLTNHNTDLIHDLYGGKGYDIQVVGVKRLIAADAGKRTGEEVIIRNY